MIVISPDFIPFFFFFNDTATTEIYTLSLHDALPISANRGPGARKIGRWLVAWRSVFRFDCLKSRKTERSEEHTSELQSPCNLVCRLLLEKKKKKNKPNRAYWLGNIDST